MGFFSTKKTYVSSTLYNLAGDENERSDYLKSLVVGNIVSNSKFSMADALQGGYINGPGMRMRNFFRWAESNYTGIGVPAGSLGGRSNVDYGIVEDHIPHAAGEAIKVQYVEVGSADYSFWAEQWMFNNYPELVTSAWLSDFDEVTNEIVIKFADLTQASFAPTGFNLVKDYVYAAYSVVYPTETEPVVAGPTTIIAPATDPFPAITGWALVSDVTTVVGVDTQQTEVYEKTDYMGQDPTPGADILYSVKSVLTRNTTRNPELVVTDRRYQTDTQQILHSGWSDPKMFIYKIGSGNAALDTLTYQAGSAGEYVPFIPVRLDNKFLSETYEPESYALAKKALKKATGGNLDKIIERIEDNPDLDQIDYAYVMFGVPLNVKENTGRQYLYRFFDKLRMSQITDTTQHTVWQGDMATYDAGVTTWNEWKDAQQDGNNPSFGTAQPSIPTRPSKTGQVVHIKTTGSLNTNLDMKIGWDLITKTAGVGLKKPDAKPGDYWLSVEPLPPGVPDKIKASGTILMKDREDNTAFSINWQVDDNNWRSLLVLSAVHENLIYKKKSVRINGKEALEDLDESGFLVPIHYPTLKEMSLVDSTQMATANSFIVFNSYKVVKKKWYQTGIFKIVLFVAMIVITIAYPPLGAATVAAWASIGAVIGLTGLAAVVVGAVISQLVSMIIMRIIGTISTAVFGEKFGQIFAAVAAFVATIVGSNLASGGNLATAWSSLMSAQNLINLSMSVGNGIAGYISASASQKLQQSSKLMEEYEIKSDELSELFAQNLGFGMGVIDPMSLTDIDTGNFVESEQQFLTRTLMTGSDIAELSMGMLTNFSELTLSIDLPNNK